MISIRTKLTLGFGAILIIVAGIGLLIIAQLTNLGQAIDVILRENYRSVVACQNMKEALERIDSGILISMNGNPALGNRQIKKNLAAFDQALLIEKHNITLPGEQKLVDSLDSKYKQYITLTNQTINASMTIEERKKLYYFKILPVFQKTKEYAQKILILNQDNMSQANNQARKQAASAKARMLLVIFICGFMTVLFSLLTRIWVLKPIRSLIDSVNDVSEGNLELVLHSNSHDEIGKLALSFNKMTEALRQKKRTDGIKLQQTRQMAQEVISAISTAVAITDDTGKIEIATSSAQKLLRMKIGSSVYDTSLTWLPQLYNQAISTGLMAEYPAEKGYIQTFNDFKEYFFQPVVIPITQGNDDHQPNGAVILFRDMTQQQEQQELKQSVVSTVSHQLKTPLTALRMSIHLLLDERIGNLNDKQLELAQAAREESERLANIVEDLLSIHRIRNNQQMLNLKLTEPQALVNEGVIPYLSMAKDKGITLTTDIPSGLPFVKVDASRFSYVFANYITNAISYTAVGGKINVTAKATDDKVRFKITDTGIGIAPEHLEHIFEQFYRVPDAEHSNGAGLGLAIVKEIVQAHGGEVGVESVLNQGSTFWFELPAYPADKSNLKVIPNGGK